MATARSIVAAATTQSRNPLPGRAKDRLRVRINWPARSGGSGLDEAVWRLRPEIRRLRQTSRCYVSAHEAFEASMTPAIRVVLALAAALGTLAIARVVSAREENHPMPLPLSVGVGVVLFVVYVTIALSV